MHLNKILTDISLIIVRGAIGDFIVKTSGLLLALMMSIFIARTIGVAEFGYYSIVIAWVTVISIFARIGMDSGVLRLVAAYRAKNEDQLLCGVIKWMVRSVLLVSIIISTLFLFLLLFLKEDINLDLFSAFIIGAFLIPPQSVVQLLMYAMRGMRLIVTGQAPEIILKPIFIMGILGILVISHVQIKAMDIIVITLFVTVITLFITHALLLKSLPKDNKKTQINYPKKRVVEDFTATVISI